MSKKATVVYGRKRLPVPKSQTNFDVYVDDDNSENVPPLSHKPSESADGLQLFSYSAEAAQESPLAKISKVKKKTRGIRYKKCKQSKTTKAKRKPIEQPHSPQKNIPVVNFEEFENYSLAVTLEKTKIENIESEVNSHAIQKHVDSKTKIDMSLPALSVHSQGNGAVHLASTPANLGAKLSSIVLGSAKESPVISPPSDEKCGCGIEMVGNAKLFTPRLGTCKYSLRSSGRLIDAFNSSLKASTMSKPTENDQPSTKLDDKSGQQKSVRFADLPLPHNLRKTNSTNKTEGKSADISALPDRILRSHSASSSRGVVNTSVPFDRILRNRSTSSSTLDIPNVSVPAEKSLRSLFGNSSSGIDELIPDVNSPLVEDHVPAIEEADEQEVNVPFSDNVSPDPAVTTQLLGELSTKQFEISHIPCTTPQIGEISNVNLVSQPNISEYPESELGDVVGDLVSLPKLNKRNALLQSDTSVFDTSMRRKSLLLREISVVEQPTTTIEIEDEAEVFAKSRLSVLTSGERRPSLLNLTPLQKLLHVCNQNNVLSFDNYFTAADRKACVKIGEGVSGEVFKVSVPGKPCRVVKVIPVNGSTQFNDADQKTFSDILAEVVVSKKTSSFSSAAAELHQHGSGGGSRRISRRFTIPNDEADQVTNASPNFVLINHVRVVQGLFPSFLVDEWNKFSDTKGSENDHPNQFPENQHFLVFDSVFGGGALENFKFSSAWQALGVVAQVAISIAVGEVACCLEHRDLHWGNILVHSSAGDRLEYRIGKKQISVASTGIEVSIIDFTLSRCSEDGVVVFTNLSQDEGIFQGEGDFQFEVYRLMRKETNDNWAAYTPRTNCFWLQYLLDKLVHKVSYPKSSNKQHTKSMTVLRKLLTQVKSCESAGYFVDHDLLPLAFELLSISS